MLGLFALVLRLAVRLAVAGDACGDVPERVRPGVLGRMPREHCHARQAKVNLRLPA
jgi:hypothetical protein